MIASLTVPSNGWEVFSETETCKFTASAPGTYKISVVAINGAVNVADFTVKKTGEVSSDRYIEINGYQISTTLGGFRTVYSVYDPDNEVSEVGLVYGLGSYATESEMVVNSQNKYVSDYKGTDEIGKMDNYVFGDNPDAISYAMTMTFGDAPSTFFTEKMMVRAYAKLVDGTVMYSDVRTMTIYDVANVLYQNRKMSNKAAHDYLYNNILTKVNTSSQEVDYDWGSTIIKPE